MRALAAALLLGVANGAFAKDPDCADAEGWAASQVHVQLMNAGLFDPYLIDFTKTTVRLISSSRIGKNEYRQVHLVRYHQSDGPVIEAITVNNVSREECSLSDIDIYLVSRKFGNYSDATGKPIPLDLGPAAKLPPLPRPKPARR